MPAGTTLTTEQLKVFILHARCCLADKGNEYVNKITWGLNSDTIDCQRIKLLLIDKYIYYLVGFDMGQDFDLSCIDEKKVYTMIERINKFCGICNFKRPDLSD